ncbi:MAG: dockerin type I repeat-containing protein [Candidatus Zixiibacteriota bacterium]
MKIMNRRLVGGVVLSLFGLTCLLVAPSDIHSRLRQMTSDEMNAESTRGGKFNLPNPQQRVHRTSNVRACMTNWGFVGSQTRGLDESKGGCFNPNPEQEVPAPSFEYPPGSGLEYLFEGAVWIGAKINNAIYTSVGCDGWFWINELWPDAGDPGAIKERSTRPNAACYSEDAFSDQDVIAVYYDTSADIPLSPEPQDPWDNRRHHPLGVQVTQTSHSWAAEGYDKFIIVDYSIKNIGVNFLSQMYIGFYMDPDIMHINEDPFGPYGGQDDITGFLRVYQGDTVNIAWAADNDGHGIAGEGVWTQFSPRSVIGMKVLATPNPNLQISYNWWISNQAGAPKDWGPWKASSQAVWRAMNPYGSGNVLPDNVLGTPGGDVSKYFIMSNGEIDYDQLFSCVWPSEHPEEGWLDPSPECADLANGYDTRFLLSFGPFAEIAPGDSLNFAVAYVIGETLHVDPLNLVHDPNLTNPQAYYSRLYFGDLVHNALKAESLYLRNYPPRPFSLLYPPNKASVFHRVRFDWENATDPNPFDQVRYDLYVSTSYRFPPDSTVIDSNLTKSEYVKSLAIGTYYWKVKAKDGHEGATWSDGVGFFWVKPIPYYPVGDFNQDGGIDIGDVVFAINYLFKSGPAPDSLESGDVNCDGVIDAGDVICLTNHLFKNGPLPPCP